MTIFGSDVSHYDAADTRKMFAAGVSFQTHKAGGDSSDAELSSWWGYVKPYRYSVLLGAYWVLYPGNPSGRADSFIARLDSQCPGWRDGPFILQVDCEKWNGNPNTAPSVSEINTFCDRLVERMPKLRPIAYAPEWVYGGKVSSLRYPLWASKYVGGSGSMTSLYPGDTSSKWGSYGGKTPAILQFTSSATIGGQTTCDANAYRGTLKELTALLAPGWTEQPVKETDVELTDTYGDRGWPKRTIADRTRDDAALRDVLWGDKPGTEAANLSPNSPLAQLLATPAAVKALNDRLDMIEAQLDALVAGAQPPVITQDQINAAVLAAFKQFITGAV